jgi:aminopeptidase-like protein
VHPGADDNASGVAVLLELARQLVQDSTSARFNYLFLFPSAHEIGLYGSKSVVQSRLLDTLNIRAVINLDMVGRMDAREHRVRVNHCFKGIDFIFNDRAPDAVRITTEDASMITNDLTIFCEAGLPAMSITTGLHQDYHRCSDTADKLNYAGMVEIKDLLIHMLKKL